MLFSVVTAPLGGAGGAARLAIAPIKVLRHAAQMEAFANHATTLLKLAGYFENAGNLGTLAKAGNTSRIVDLADEASDTLRGVQAPNSAGTVIDYLVPQELRGKP
ncbi:hypothetical protein [Roseimaritima sediminicola]|uniref:hypothetical protein n=1 Tax=Roseimaritima sediminicola TaxID=2662066 RepID=UPI0013869B30|nr:hypothetical protein [Roseimaritima sediminicola]